MPTRRGCRASWCGWCATRNLPEPLDALEMKHIPKEPLAEFLADQGFKTLHARLMGGGGATQTGATVRNDVMAALDRKPAAPPAEPETIEVDRSKYETVTDEAALDRWIAEATAQGYVAVDTETDCIDCIIAKLAGRQPGDWRRTRPATSRSGTAARTSIPTRRTSCRWHSCWRS